MIPRLDFTTLKIFTSVADTKNITRAAELENIASSAVSKRLSDLEHALGTQLLYRLPRGVELTPAGEALLRHARSLLHSAEQLAADLGDYASGVRGEVRLAVNASSAAEFLPADFATFCDLYPEVRISLQEANTAWILKAISDSKFDIGVFAGSESGHDNVEVVPYREDSFVLVVPHDHPFAKRKSISFEETLSQYFVGLEAGTAWDSLLSHAAVMAGRPIRYRFRLRNTLSIFQMVAAGLGIFIAPHTMARVISPAVRLKVVHLDEVWAHRQLSIATRGVTSLNPAGRMMFEHLTRSGSKAVALASG